MRIRANQTMAHGQNGVVDESNSILDAGKLPYRNLQEGEPDKA